MTPGERINKQIQFEGINTNLISDGYHTFGELYDHRIALFIALCKVVHYSDKYEFPVWRSKLHSDGSSFDGWFVLGIGFKKGEQITYHLPIKDWEKCWFAKELDKAPDFDGHSSNDVLERLRVL